MRKIFPVNKKASKASFPGFILPTSPVPILSSISQHPPLVTNASWLLVEIPTYSDTVSVLKMSDFRSAAVWEREMRWLGPLCARCHPISFARGYRVISNSRASGPGVFTGAAANVNTVPPHPCHLAAVRIDAKHITPPVTAASL